jgi:two-component sensor histidine kinase
MNALEKTLAAPFHAQPRTRRLVVTVLLTSGALAVLYLLNLRHFLLFHFAAELFSISVAFSVFAVTWSARERIEDGGWLLIGVSYLFVGAVDLVHTLSYEGTGLFPGYGANLPTQLWLLARYLETASLLLGLRLFGQRVPHRTVIMGYTLVTVVAILSIIPLGIFPDAYVAGEGLTAFKIASEYTISAGLLVAAYVLYRLRGQLDDIVFRWLFAAILVTAVSEILFTFYIDVYGISNALGHILKIVSYYAVFKAIVELGIRRPDRLFYRRLATREEELSQALSERDMLLREMQHRVKNDMSLMKSFLSLQAAQSEDPEVRQSLDEAGSRVSILARTYENIYKSTHVETVEVNLLLRRTVSDLRDSTGFGNIRFELDLAEVTVPTKVGVAVALIVNELVTNALKYAFTGTEDPLIRVSVTLPERGVLELDVRDNGGGFPQSVLAGHSYGYGLTLAKALVRQHNGSIAFENDNGGVVNARLRFAEE